MVGRRTHQDSVADHRDEGRDDESHDDEQAALSAAQAAKVAVRHIANLTTKDTVGAVSVEPVEDGWLVGVEMLEQRRVPSTSDMLALFEAEIDMDGNLLSYRRVRRYARGRGSGGNGGA